MPAPDGTVANRWNQVVRVVSTDQGWTDEQSDTWLSSVWLTMWQGDEIAGEIVAHEKLRAWLELNVPGASTLPRAFEQIVT